MMKIGCSTRPSPFRMGIIGTGEFLCTVLGSVLGSASEMTYIVSGGALNSTHSLVRFRSATLTVQYGIKSNLGAPPQI